MHVCTVLFIHFSLFVQSCDCQLFLINASLSFLFYETNIGFDGVIQNKEA